MNFESLGVAGLLAMLYTARSWLQSIWAQLSSLIIVQVSLEHILLRRAVEDYIFSSMTPSPLGPRTYEAAIANTYTSTGVPPLIVLEVLGTNSRLFWYGWVPVWVAGTGSQAYSGSIALGGSADAGGSAPKLALTYFRYTLSLETLVEAAIAARYSQVQDTVSRHQIIRRTGMGRQNNSSFAVNESAPSSKGGGNAGSWWTEIDMRGRVLGGRPPRLSATARSLSDLWLCPDAKAVLADIEYWLQSRLWFEQVGIPWRRNYLLWGAPGTGKSSFAKFVAQKYDLPLYVIELNTMCDRELYNLMESIRMETPCVVLYEDVDNSFNKREKAAPDLECSFQAWQSVLDGVKTSDGILTFVTTNRPECLDESVALFHREEEHFGGITAAYVECTRPGRIDQAAEMLSLPREGREQLVLRYLSDFTDSERAQLVTDTDDCTAAIFQDQCVQLAIQRRFQKDQHEFVVEKC